jgi:hypothetical protein
MRGGTGLQSDLLRGRKQGSVSSSESEDSDSDEEKALVSAREGRDFLKAGNLFWEFRNQVAEELRQLTVSRVAQS